MIENGLKVENGSLLVDTNSVSSPSIVYGLATNNGRLYVNDLLSDPVPAGRQLINGLSCDYQGALYVTSDTPEGSNYINGLRCRYDGAVFVSSSVSPVEYTNGMPIASDGSLIIDDT